MSDGIASFARHDGWWEFYLPHPPTPASRPRISRWGAYYSKTYRNWRLDTEASLACVPRPKVTTKEPVFVTVYSVCKRPQKLTQPYPRGDVDNYAKAVLDAITNAKIIWHDDTQVMILNISKRYAEPDEEPHTYVHVSLNRYAPGTRSLGGHHHVGDDVYDLPPEDRESLNG